MSAVDDARALQMLVTGMIGGALSGHAVRPDGVDWSGVAIDVEVATDADGNYLPELLVTGQRSGTRLRVAVEILEDGDGRER